jgi:hypothetical protein
MFHSDEFTENEWRWFEKWVASEDSRKQRNYRLRNKEKQDEDRPLTIHEAKQLIEDQRRAYQPKPMRSLPPLPPKPPRDSPAVEMAKRDVAHVLQRYKTEQPVKGYVNCLGEWTR